jgi:hypothetical protein
MGAENRVRRGRLLSAARPAPHLDRLDDAKGLALGHGRADLGELHVDDIAELRLGCAR